MKNTFLEVYQPVLTKFLEEIKGIKMNNLPEPFIPVAGDNYFQSSIKIAFVGWETRNNADLLGFYNSATTDKDPIESLTRYKEIIDEENGYCFLKYGNNFGNAFWDFNLNFLSRFYEVDLKALRNIEIPEILKSFLYGNINSIEGFGVTAEENGGDFESWKKLKKASLVFDDADLMIKAFNPDLIIVLRWQEDDSWLTKNKIRGVDYLYETLIDEQLDYYFLPATNTHIYWTRHPLGMSRNKIDQDIIIMKVLDSFCRKEKLKIIPCKQRIEDIDVLNSQAKTLALEMGLLPETLNSGGKYAGIYFRKPNWNRCCIGFEFDEKWGSDFFKGIKKNKEDITIDEESIKRKFNVKENSTPWWPYWQWCEEKYRNWDQKVFDAIRTGKLIQYIKHELELMLSKMSELEREGVQL